MTKREVREFCHKALNVAVTIILVVALGLPVQGLQAFAASEQDGAEPVAMSQREGGGDSIRSSAGQASLAPAVTDLDSAGTSDTPDGQGVAGRAASGNPYDAGSSTEASDPEAHPAPGSEFHLTGTTVLQDVPGEVVETGGLGTYDPESSPQNSPDSDSPLMAFGAFLSGLFDAQADGNPDDSRTLDGTTLEHVTIQWLTHSNDDDLPSPQDPNTLYVKTDTDDSPVMQYQVDFATSGQYPYEAGELEIIVPAQVFRDREGNLVGSQSVSVPEDFDDATAFNYSLVRHDDDGLLYYHIKNVRRIDAASKYMFQFTLRELVPHDIVSKQVSENLSATVNLTTRMGNVISLTSSDLQARINTQERITVARKQAGSVYSTSAAAKADAQPVTDEMIAKLLQLYPNTRPDDYYYARWYTWGTVSGNQHSTLSLVDDVTDLDTEYNPIMLGAIVVDGDTVISQDGKTVGANVQTGWIKPGTSRYAYVWTAYPKDKFPEENKRYTLHNTATWSVTESDEKTVTHLDGRASIALNTPRSFHIDKVWKDDNNARNLRPEKVTVNVSRCAPDSNYYAPWDSFELSEENNWTVEVEDDSATAYTYRVTENAVPYYFNEVSYNSTSNTYTVTNWYRDPGHLPNPSLNTSKRTLNYTDSEPQSSSDRALNDLDERRSNPIVNFAVEARAMIAPYTMKLTGYHLPPTSEDYNARHATFELADFRIMHAGEQLNEADYDIVSIKVPEPTLYKYGAYEDNPGAYWDYQQIPAPESLPDVEVWGRAGIDEADNVLTASDWKRYAKISYTSTNRGFTATVETENGASTDGASTPTITFPEGAQPSQVKTKSVTNASGIAQTYTLGVRINTTDRMAKLAAETLGGSDHPMATLTNHSRAIVTHDKSVHSDDTSTVDVNDQWSPFFFHGRQLRVATSSIKSMYADNAYNNSNEAKIGKRARLHNQARVITQTNILNKADYDLRRDQGYIPVDGQFTWYDLLPIGAEPDTTSVTLAEGDILTFVDTIPNFRGSGRTLLIVEGIAARHESYANATDVGSAGFNGYRNTNTVSFDSYYTWDAYLDHGTQLTNVIAFETGDDFLGNVQGHKGEPDDPTKGQNIQSASAVKGVEEYFTDLDETTDDPRFVYARATAGLHLDVNAGTGVEKKVSVDGTGEWFDKNAWRDGHAGVVEVGAGQRYTYQMRVASDANTHTDEIVLLDYIEGYKPTADKTGYGDKQWKGHLKSIDVSELSGRGINVKMYYVPRSYIDEHPEFAIDDTHGLYRKNDQNYYVDDNGVPETDPAFDGNYQLMLGWQPYTAYVDPNDVAAIAIDAMKKTDGQNFVLDPRQSMSVYIHMVGPQVDEAAAVAGDSTFVDAAVAFEGKAHAYNNVYLHCSHAAGGAYQPDVIHDEYTRVSLAPLTVNVQKKWDDEDDNDGKRPESVNVQLLANDEPVSGKFATLNEDNGWKASFTGLPYADQDGNRYRFTFAETMADGSALPEGYTSVTAMVDQNGNYQLINTRPPELVSVSGEKAWTGDSDEDGAVSPDRPESITVRLERKLPVDTAWEIAAEPQTVTPDAEDGTWRYEFTGLKKYDQGREVQYRVVETPVYKYVPSYGDLQTGEDAYTQNMSNTYHPYGELAVGKTVENGTADARSREFTYTITLEGPADEETRERPRLEGEFAYVKLGASGEQVATGTIRNGQTFTLKDGQQLKLLEVPSETLCTVQEDEATGFVAHAYTLEQTIVANQTANIAFRNTYNAEGRTSVRASKTLSGRDIKPGQFYFRLLSRNEGTDGQVVRTAGNTGTGAAEVAFGAIGYRLQDLWDDSLNEGEGGYASQKTFDYDIVETDRGLPGYTYDSTAYRARVTVTDNGSGSLQTSVAYYRVDGEGAEARLEPLDERPTFSNTYQAEGQTGFTAWKTVPDTKLAGGEFQFELLRQVNDSSDAWEPVTDAEGNAVFANEAGGTITFPEVAFSEADDGKTFTFKAREVIPADARAYIDSKPLDPAVTYGQYADNDESIPSDKRNQVQWAKGGYVYTADAFLYRVKVTDNGNGTLSFDQEVANAQGETQVDEQPVQPVFKNDVLPGSLSIEKQRTGTTTGYDPDQVFRFKVELEGSQLHDSGSVDYTIEQLDPSLSPRGAATQPAPQTAPQTADATSRATKPAPQMADAPSPATKSAPRSLSPQSGGALSVNGVWPGESAEVMDWGTFGTYNSCIWEYYDDDTLVIRPRTGEVGSVANSDSTTFVKSCPWASYKNTVKHVQFMGKIRHKFDAGGYSDFVNNNMFKDYTALETVALSGYTPLTGSDKASTRSMFENCTSLTNVDFTGADLSDVTASDSMFQGCTSLESFDMNDFPLNTDTTNPNITMGRMFYGCTGLKHVTLKSPRFEASRSHREMFTGCTSLETVDMSGVQINAHTDFSSFFDGCTGLKSVDMRGAHFTVHFTQYFFNGCTSLETVLFEGTSFEYPNADISMNCMFKGCTSLVEIDMSKAEISSKASLKNFVENCTNLEKLALPASPFKVTSATGLFDTKSRILREVDFGGMNIEDATDDSFGSNNNTLYAYTAKSSAGLRKVTFGPNFNESKEFTLGQVSGRSMQEGEIPFVWAHVGSELTDYTTNFRTFAGRRISPTGTWHLVARAQPNYNPNGGVGNMPDAIKVYDVPPFSGEDASDLASLEYPLDMNRFVRDGYTFVSWNTKADGSGTTYLDGDQVKIHSFDVSNNAYQITLFAQWEEGSRYFVYFDPGDGAGSMAPAMPESAEDYQVPVGTFYRYGYRLAGWSDGKGKIFKPGDSETGFIPANSVRQGESVTLTAVWEPIEQKVDLSSGSFEIDLRAGERATIPSIPAGTHYRVYEETPAGWVLVSQSGQTGTITPEQVSAALFQNRYQPGAVSVSLSALKLVDGEPADEGSNYTFSLQSVNASNPVQSGVKPGGGGVVTFNPIVFTAAGTYRYYIQEARQSDSTMTYDTTAKYVTINVTSNGAGGLDADVVYEEGGTQAVVNNVHRPGSLTLYKATNGATSAARSDRFTLRVTFMNPDVPEWNNRIEEYTMSGNARQNINDIPYGTTYSISETDIPIGWSLEGITNGSGEIVPGGTVQATVTNRYDNPSDTVQISATKRLVGRSWKAGESYRFILRSPNSSSFYRTADATESNPTAQFGDFTFTLDDLREGGVLLESKTFYYTITEEIPYDARAENNRNLTYRYANAVQRQANTWVYNGVRYDKEERRVIVEVRRTPDGGLYASASYAEEGDHEPPAFVNEYAPTPVAFQVQAYKSVDGVLGAALNAYTFEVLDDNDDYEGIEYTADTTPVKGDVVSRFAVPANRTNQVANVPTVRFTQPGTYHFKLREFIPDGAKAVDNEHMTYSAETTTAERERHTWKHNGVVYDSKLRDVTVTVTDPANDGALVASVVYDDEEQAVFDNSYQPEGALAQLNVGKYLTNPDGSVYQRDWTGGDYFTFVVTRADGSAFHVQDAEGNVSSVSSMVDTLRSGHRSTSFDPIAFTVDDMKDERGRRVTDKTFEFRVHELVLDETGTDLNAQGAGVVYRGFTYAPDQTINVHVHDNSDGTYQVRYGGNTYGWGSNVSPELRFENKYEITQPVSTDIFARKRIVDHSGSQEIDSWVKYKQNESGNSVVEHDWSEKTFTIELKSSRDDTPMPDMDGVAVEQRTDNNGQGKVARLQVSASNRSAVFQNITFTQPGEWDYEITEVLPDGVDRNHPTSLADELSYDTSTHSVRVVVADNGDGTLQVPRVTYSGNAQQTETLITNREPGSADIVLQTRKSLSGGAQMRGGEFSFVLYELTPDSGGHTDFAVPEGATVVNRATNTTEGAVYGEPIEYTATDIKDHTSTTNPHEQWFYYVGRELAGENPSIRYDTENDSRFAVLVREIERVPGSPEQNTVVIQEVWAGNSKDANASPTQGDLGSYGLTKLYERTLESGSETEYVEWADVVNNLEETAWPTHENVYASSVEAQVKVDKFIDGRRWSDSDSFTFTLTGAPSSKAGVASPLHLAGQPSGDPDKLERTVSGASGGLDASTGRHSATFDTLMFTMADLANKDNAGNVTGYDTSRTFHYLVQESVPNDAVNGSGKKYENATTAEKAAGGFVKDGLEYARPQKTSITLTSTDYGLQVTYDDNATDPEPLEFSNVYQIREPQTAQLKAVKELDGREWGTGDDFEFVLEAGNNTAADGIGTPMPEGAGDHAHATANSGTANVEALFGAITFTADGTYSYTVREVIPDDAVNAGGKTYREASDDEKAAGGFTRNGLEYTNAVRSITVTVRDKGDGTLAEPVVAYGQRAEPDPFRNVYRRTPASVSINGRKTMVGRDLITGHYRFQIFQAQKVGNEVRALDVQPDGWPHIAVADLNEGSTRVGSLVSEGMEFTQPGTYYFVVREDKTESAFDAVVFDQHEVPVTVTVTDKDETGAYTGELRATVTYDNSASTVEDDKAQTELAAFTNSYSATGSATLKVTKNLVGREWSDSDSFEFTLAAAGTTPDAPLPEGAQRTVRVGKESVDFTEAFGTISFTQDDIGKNYEYTITETHAGETVDGTSYPAQTCTAHVHVADTGTGRLVASVSYNGTWDQDEGVWEDTVPALVVTNTYEASARFTLPVRKQLSGTGRLWTADDAFSFTLEAGDNDAGVSTPMPEGTPEGQSRQTLTLDSSSPHVSETGPGTYRRDAFAPITFTKPGTYYYMLTEDEHLDEQGNAVNPYRGLQYDETVHEIAVTVTDPDFNGDLSVDVDYEADLRVHENEPAFVNEYVPDPAVLNLQAVKTLNGKSPGEAGMPEGFDFTLHRVTSGAGTAAEARELVQTVAQSEPGTGRIAFDPITLDQDVLTKTAADGHSYGDLVYVMSEVVPDHATRDEDPDSTGYGMRHWNGIWYDDHETYVHVRVEDLIDGLPALFVTDVQYGHYHNGTFVSEGSHEVGAGAAEVTTEPASFQFANRCMPFGSAEIPVSKEMTGRSWLESDEFSFSLECIGELVTDDEGQPAIVRDVADAPALVDEDGHIVESQVVKATAENRTPKFHVGFASRHAERSFVYTIREEVPAGAERAEDGSCLWHGIAYDPAEYTVTLSSRVDPDDSENLLIDVQFDGDHSQATFVNPWSAPDVTVPIRATKVLSGDDAPDMSEGMFRFALLDSAGEQVGEVVANERDGAVHLGDLTFGADDLWVQDEWLPTREFAYSIREIAPDQAVNAQGTTWAKATDAQRAAGGFSLDGVTYAADVPVSVTLSYAPETGGLECTASYGPNADTEARIVNVYGDVPKPPTPVPPQADPPTPEDEPKQNHESYWRNRLVQAGDPLACSALAGAAAVALAVAAFALRRSRRDGRR